MPDVFLPPPNAFATLFAGLSAMGAVVSVLCAEIDVPCWVPLAVLGLFGIIPLAFGLLNHTLVAAVFATV